MERGLVATQIYLNVFLGKPLPQVDNIAYVCHGHRTALANCCTYGRYQLVKAVVQLIHPSLLVAFGGSLGIDFRYHAHHASYVSGLWLCSRHASKSRRDEQHTADAISFRLRLELLAGSVENGYGGAVDDALRTYIHV